MKRLLPFLSVLILLYACKKNNDLPPEPTVEYINLNNVEVKDGVFQRVDLDDNNTQDFTFTTRIITDPALNQTKFQFLVISRLDAYLLLTTGTQSAKKFMKGDSIRTVASPGSSWAAFSLVIMTQKITPASAAPYWEGEWKDASRHFLPVKVTKRSGEVHTGWIELSMDIANEKMILHKAAISLEPEQDLKAGD